MRPFLDKSRVWHTVAMLCPESRLRARTRLRRACGVALLLTAVSSAQSTVAAPAPEQASEPIATLHVYTNLAQMPVLVLTPLREEMKPITEARFRLSIDGGQPFKPTHVRREADDPLSLAILIDTTKPRFDLLPKVEDAIVSLAPSLLPQDHVTLSVMACGLVETHEIPADPASLRAAAAAVMQPYRDRIAHPTPDRCRPALPLWDAMAHLTAQLWQRKGRRVLIVLSDGRDTGSKTTWQKVQEVTQATSTTVFGIVTAPVTLTGRNFNTEDQDLFRRAHLRNANGFEDPFNFIAELSGGLTLSANRKNLDKRLQHVIQMVRERYIVEFPRDDRVAAGNHSVEVTIISADAYIRSAGITVPLADPTIRANPLTLPAGEQVTPVRAAPAAPSPKDAPAPPNPPPLTG